ncbi:MAG: kelch repeat-containing protein, partial [Byssovorax sp.]
GEVLITGGTDATTLSLSTTLLYDPHEDRFSSELEMKSARVNHTATALPSGEVLITGGIIVDGLTTKLCELYDPQTGEFSDTKGPMTTGRAFHSATLLPSGEVLIVGGTSSVSPVAGETDNIGNAELYNPVSTKFRPTGALVGPFPPAGQSTATLLPSGEVLIVGVGSPELYDPAAGEFRVNVSASGNAPKLFGHAAALLPSGRVLLVGGTVGLEDGTGEPKYLPWPLIYTPASGEIEAQASDEATKRTFGGATLLASGEVLITGGNNKETFKLAKARRWNEAPDAAFRPQITGVKARVLGDRTLTIHGDWGSLGPDTGGGSSSSSASNHPIAIWMPWTGGAEMGRISDWTPTTATWTAPHGGLLGSGLLFVSSGGVVSAGVEIEVGTGAACTSNLDCSTGLVCSAQGSCGDPVDAGGPARGCAITVGDPAPEGTGPAIALLFGMAIAAIRRRERGTPTSRCRAG